jgi:hypothetical protein
MTMKPWIVVIAAAALGFAIHALTSPDRTPTPLENPRASAAPSPGRLEAGRSAIGLPGRGPPPALEELARAVRAAPEEPAGSGSASGKTAPSSEEIRDRFAVFFTSERVDTAWSRGAAEALTKGAQAVLPGGSRLHRVECRETLCRVEIEHASADEFRTFVQSAFFENETRISKSGFFASALDEPSLGGPVTAIAYVAREGKGLPAPDVLFASR